MHLVRAANGLDVFSAFLNALRRNPPGVEFELVLAMKGFDSPREAEPYLALAAATPAEVLHFSDEGLDLGVYFAVAARLQRDRYCFLNSYSEPLVPGWLAKLDAAFERPGVGLAGATGSWGSTRSWTAHALRLPSAYRGVLPKASEAIAQFMALEAARAGTAVPSHRSYLEKTHARVKTISEIPSVTLPFERFPAYHVRTNAFVIAHATLARLRLRRVKTKQDAYRVENGRHSITRQVQRAGLRTLVVDRFGAVYDHQQWPRSRTFWQADQEGLLVADNQTRLYADGDGARRRLLAGFAWGLDADATPPRERPGGGTR